MSHAAAHKQRVLGRILGPLKKHFDVSEPAARPVLDQMIFAVCREDAPRDKAEHAFTALQSAYFDWNEVRVSGVREVEGTLAGLPRAGDRAERIIHLLQDVFESTYSFDLETLQKKPLKQAQKQLERHQGATPFVVAYTVQQGLNGHAVPLDQSTRRTLLRLEMIEDGPDEQIHASLEHLVPKAKAPLFAETVAALAQKYCKEDPHCGRCPMNDMCPVGMEAKQRTPAAAGRKRS
jgi:endonuclease-3